MKYLEAIEFLKQNDLTEEKANKIFEKVSEKVRFYKKFTHWSELPAGRLHGMLRIYKDIPPKTCGECDYFVDAPTDWGKKHGLTFCFFSNEQTWGFQNPLDRPVPRPTKCPYNPVNNILHLDARDVRTCLKNE